MKDFRDRILPVEEKIDNFRELSSFYRDREQLLNYAFDLLSSDFVDIIPEILRVCYKQHYLCLQYIRLITIILYFMLLEFVLKSIVLALVDLIDTCCGYLLLIN